MAIKTKDYCVDLSDFKSEGHGINAAKKTALKIEGINIGDIGNKIRLDIIDDLLVVTNTDNNTKLFVKKYSKLKYIKTGNNEIVNIINDGLVINTQNITTYNKKLISNGTKYSDIINFENSAYKPNGKNNIKHNRGLKINGKSGNDTIIGTDYNDIIKGGAGCDTIIGGIGEDKIYGGDGFNTIKYNNIEEISGDKIYLTKGENLAIDISKIETSEISYRVSGKDLILTVNDENTSSEFTIVNFGTKDITNNSNSKKNYPDTSSVELITKDEIIDLREDAVVVSDFGTYHNDYIKRNNYKIYKKNKKTKINELVTDISHKGLSINGLAGNDTIIGTNYSDTIKSGIGMNFVEGMTGNDRLYGGSSEDSQTTFSFKIGDNNDTIYSGKGSDSVLINDVELSYKNFKQGTNKNNKDLIIQYSDNDSITIKNYYLVDKYGNILGIDKNNSIKQIQVGNSEFVLGTPNSEIMETGDDANLIYAMGGNDSIISYIGNDTIYGQQGNDTICAGQGSDYIDGGENDDVYIFSSGDGNDTIAPCDSNFDNDVIIFKENQNLTYGKKFDSLDLVINYNNSSDITLLDYFYDSLKYPLTIINGELEPQSLQEQLSKNSLYITGSNWDDSITGIKDSTKVKNNIIYGYEGDDTILGSLNNDTIVGGTGDDIININDKNNYTLVFNSNDGNDTINFWDNFSSKENVLNFEDVSYSDFVYEKSGDNLIIKYTNEDSIILNNYFEYVTYIHNPEENDHSFKISDKDTNVFLSDVINFEISGSGEIKGTIYNDKIVGSLNDDTIKGDYGNDTIYSNGGRDCIYGEKGDDIIYGGNNDNYLYGGEGNDIIHVGTTDKSWVEGGLGNDTIYSGTGKEISGNGSQVIRLYGEEGDDTYIIESDLTNAIEIEDTIGDNIIQIITKSKDDISIYSNIHYIYEGESILPVIKDLYLNNISDFGKTNYGIRISDFASEANQEPVVPSNTTVITNDGYFLDYSTVYQAYVEVASWLSKSGFATTGQVLSEGSNTQKETLEGILNNVWQVYDNKIN